MKTGMTYEQNIENKVLAYCRKSAMFEDGDRVVLGVSGGADSICLLFVLLRLQEPLGIELCVVHVNHLIRPDAGEDAAYVRSLCDTYRVPFVLKEVDVQCLAGELGVGTEEAGRIARYEAFTEVSEKFRANKIGVAHNSNDRAETMLFHLFRGTGLKGMAGILPVRDQIVRPLLCLERSEIEEYLRHRGIDYRMDSTNETDDYTRNRIRRNIIPYVKENIAEGCIENMCRAADIFAQEEAYLEEQTQAAFAGCVVSTFSQKKEQDSLGTEQKVELLAEAVLKQHPVIRKRMIMQVLKNLSPGQQDITATHIEDILSLFENKVNRQIHLPYHIRGERIYDSVFLERGLKQEVDSRFFDLGVPRLCEEGQVKEVFLPDGSKMEFLLIGKPAEMEENPAFFQNISENMYTKWFDYDKIIKWLRVRTRQTGDYLTIRGSQTLQHKKLKDYMVTEKIPKQERDSIPVLAEEDHVLWLAGYRISEHYKITKNTKKILRVRWVK